MSRQKGKISQKKTLKNEVKKSTEILDQQDSVVSHKLCSSKSYSGVGNVNKKRKLHGVLGTISPALKRLRSRNSVSENKIHQCMICYLEFSNKYNLQRHERNFGKSKYPCHHCGTKFASQKQVEIHINHTHKSHVNIDKYSHSCPICYQIFRHEAHLRAHVYHYHESGLQTITKKRGQKADNTLVGENENSAKSGEKSLLEADNHSTSLEALENDSTTQHPLECQNDTTAQKIQKIATRSTNEDKNSVETENRLMVLESLDNIVTMQYPSEYPEIDTVTQTIQEVSTRLTDEAPIIVSSTTITPKSPLKHGNSEALGKNKKTKLMNDNNSKKNRKKCVIGKKRGRKVKNTLITEDEYSMGSLEIENHLTPLESLKNYSTTQDSSECLDRENSCLEVDKQSTILESLGNYVAIQHPLEYFENGNQPETIQEPATCSTDKKKSCLETENHSKLLELPENFVATQHHPEYLENNTTATIAEITTRSKDEEKNSLGTEKHSTVLESVSTFVATQYFSEYPEIDTVTQTIQEVSTRLTDEASTIACSMTINPQSPRENINAEVFEKNEKTKFTNANNSKKFGREFLFGKKRRRKVKNTLVIEHEEPKSCLEIEKRSTPFESLENYSTTQNFSECLDNGTIPKNIHELGIGSTNGEISFLDTEKHSTILECPGNYVASQHSPEYLENGKTPEKIEVITTCRMDENKSGLETENHSTLLESLENFITTQHPPEFLDNNTTTATIQRISTCSKDEEKNSLETENHTMLLESLGNFVTMQHPPEYPENNTITATIQETCTKDEEKNSFGPGNHTSLLESLGYFVTTQHPSEYLENNKITATVQEITTCSKGKDKNSLGTESHTSLLESLDNFVTRQHLPEYPENTTATATIQETCSKDEENNFLRTENHTPLLKSLGKFVTTQHPSDYLENNKTMATIQEMTTRLKDEEKNSLGTENHMTLLESLGNSVTTLYPPEYPEYDTVTQTIYEVSTRLTDDVPIASSTTINPQYSSEYSAIDTVTQTIPEVLTRSMDEAPIIVSSTTINSQTPLENDDAEASGKIEKIKLANTNNTKKIKKKSVFRKRRRRKLKNIFITEHESPKSCVKIENHSTSHEYVKNYLTAQHAPENLENDTVMQTIYEVSTRYTDDPPIIAFTTPTIPQSRLDDKNSEVSGKKVKTELSDINNIETIDNYQNSTCVVLNGHVSEDRRRNVGASRRIKKKLFGKKKQKKAEESLIVAHENPGSGVKIEKSSTLFENSENSTTQCFLENNQSVTTLEIIQEMITPKINNPETMDDYRNTRVKSEDRVNDRSKHDDGSRWTRSKSVLREKRVRRGKRNLIRENEKGAKDLDKSFSETVSHSIAVESLDNSTTHYPPENLQDDTTLDKFQEPITPSIDNARITAPSSTTISQTRLKVESTGELGKNVKTELTNTINKETMDHSQDTRAESNDRRLLRTRKTTVPQKTKVKRAKKNSTKKGAKNLSEAENRSRSLESLENYATTHFPGYLRTNRRSERIQQFTTLESTSMFSQSRLVNIRQSGEKKKKKFANSHTEKMKNDQDSHGASSAPLDDEYREPLAMMETSNEAQGSLSEKSFAEMLRNNKDIEEIDNTPVNNDNLANKAWVYVWGSYRFDANEDRYDVWRKTRERESETYRYEETEMTNTKSTGNSKDLRRTSDEIMMNAEQTEISKINNAVSSRTRKSNAKWKKRVNENFDSSVKLQDLSDKVENVLIKLREMSLEISKNFDDNENTYDNRIINDTKFDVTVENNDSEKFPGISENREQNEKTDDTRIINNTTSNIPAKDDEIFSGIFQNLEEFETTDDTEIINFNSCAPKDKDENEKCLESARCRKECEDTDNTQIINDVNLNVSEENLTIEKSLEISQKREKSENINNTLIINETIINVAEENFEVEKLLEIPENREESDNINNIQISNEPSFNVHDENLEILKSLEISKIRENSLTTDNSPVTSGTSFILLQKNNELKKIPNICENHEETERTDDNRVINATNFVLLTKQDKNKKSFEISENCEEHSSTDNTEIINDTSCNVSGEKHEKKILTICQNLKESETTDNTRVNNDMNFNVSEKQDDKKKSFEMFHNCEKSNNTEYTGSINDTSCNVPEERNEKTRFEVSESCEKSENIVNARVITDSNLNMSVEKYEKEKSLVISKKREVTESTPLISHMIFNRNEKNEEELSLEISKNREEHKDTDNTEVINSSSINTPEEMDEKNKSHEISQNRHEIENTVDTRLNDDSSFNISEKNEIEESSEIVHNHEKAEGTDNTSFMEPDQNNEKKKSLEISQNFEGNDNTDNTRVINDENFIELEKKNEELKSFGISENPQEIEKTDNARVINDANFIEIEKNHEEEKSSEVFDNCEKSINTEYTRIINDTSCNVPVVRNEKATFEMSQTAQEIENTDNTCVINNTSSKIPENKVDKEKSRVIFPNPDETEKILNTVVNSDNEENCYPNDSSESKFPVISQKTFEQKRVYKKKIYAKVRFGKPRNARMNTINRIHKRNKKGRKKKPATKLDVALAEVAALFSDINVNLPEDKDMKEQSHEINQNNEQTKKLDNPSIISDNQQNDNSAFTNESDTSEMIDQCDDSCGEKFSTDGQNYHSEETKSTNIKMKESRNVEDSVVKTTNSVDLTERPLAMMHAVPNEVEALLSEPNLRTLDANHTSPGIPEKIEKIKDTDKNLVNNVPSEKEHENGETSENFEDLEDNDNDTGVNADCQDSDDSSVTSESSLGKLVDEIDDIIRETIDADSERHVPKISEFERDNELREQYACKHCYVSITRINSDNYRSIERLNSIETIDNDYRPVHETLNPVTRINDGNHQTIETWDSIPRIFDESSNDSMTTSDNFSCTFCRVSCPTAASRTIHMDDCHTVVKSVICDKILATESAMRRHYRDYHAVGCDDNETCVCGKNMQHYEALNEHFFQYSLPRCLVARKPPFMYTACRPLRKPHVCVNCGKDFWLKTCYDLHSNDCIEANIESPEVASSTRKTARREFGKGPIHPDELMCRVCYAEFPTSTMLLKHEETYTKPANNRCLICGTIFMGQRLLNGHMRAAHTFNIDATYCCYCIICDQGFTKRIYRRIHMMHIHGEKYPTDMINKPTMVNRSAYAAYDRDNDDDASGGRCDVCDLVFVNRKRFIDHAIYYKRDETIVCKICNEQFYGRYSAHRHNKLSHYSADIRAAYPHKCSICQEGFMYKRHLKAHFSHIHDKNIDIINLMDSKRRDVDFSQGRQTKNQANEMTPSGATRVHICAICEMSFPSIDLLAAHQIEYMNDGGFVCTRCGKKHRTATLLLDHLSLNHSSTIHDSVRCYRCDENLLTIAAWISHVKHYHKSDTREPSEFYLETNIAFSKEFGISEFELIPTNGNIFSGQIYEKVRKRIDDNLPLNMVGSGKNEAKKITTSVVDLTRFVDLTSIVDATNEVNITRIIDVTNDVDAADVVDVTNNLSNVVDVTNDVRSVVDATNDGNDATSDVEIEIIEEKERITDFLKIRENEKLIAQNNFKCGACGVICYSPAALARHNELYADAGPYMCEICARRFISMRLYQEHKFKHFRRDFGNDHFCAICNEGFDTTRSMKIHQAHIHRRINDNNQYRNQSLKNITILTTAEPRTIVSNRSIERAASVPFSGVSVILANEKMADSSSINNRVENNTSQCHHKCPNCDETFVTLGKCLEHLESVHKLRQVENFDHVYPRTGIKRTAIRPISVPGKLLKIAHPANVYSNKKFISEYNTINEATVTTPSNNHPRNKQPFATANRLFIVNNTNTPQPLINVPTKRIDTVKTFVSTNQPRDKLFRCEFCDIALESEDRLIDHREQIHYVRTELSRINVETTSTKDNEVIQVVFAKKINVTDPVITNNNERTHGNDVILTRPTAEISRKIPMKIVPFLSTINQVAYKPSATMTTTSSSKSKSDDRLRCKPCDFIFPTAKLLKLHQTYVHSSVSPEIQCIDIINSNHSRTSTSSINNSVNRLQLLVNRMPTGRIDQNIGDNVAPQRSNFNFEPALMPITQFRIITKGTTVESSSVRKINEPQISSVGNKSDDNTMRILKVPSFGDVANNTKDETVRKRKNDSINEQQIALKKVRKGFFNSTAFQELCNQHEMRAKCQSRKDDFSMITLP